MDECIVMTNNRPIESGQCLKIWILCIARGLDRRPRMPGNSWISNIVWDWLFGYGLYLLKNSGLPGPGTK